MWGVASQSCKTERGLYDRLCHTVPDEGGVEGCFCKTKIAVSTEKLLPLPLVLSLNAILIGNQLYNG